MLDENKQTGKAANSYDDYYDVSGTQTPYDAAERPGFKVNADLTKQKTTGKVNFLFKHALAKIGGSYVNKGGGDATGYDDDGTTPTNGLMVVLDLDNNGAETGGSLEAYKGTPLESGSIAADNKYNTKVTINSITLNSEKQLTEEGKTAIQTNNTFEYATNTETLVSAGLFNLATGVWSDKTNTTNVSRTQTIVPSDGKSESETTDGTKDAILSKPIAEPATHPGYTKAGFESLPIGVTTVPKNVYKSDVQPFVFIPGSYPVITISIDYTVRTYDANLKDAYSEVRQKITKRLYILDAIKLNKQYSILMRLGLTSVKFDAYVSGWTTDDDENVTGSTDGVDGSTKINTSDETVEHVYLPINVATLTAVKAINPTTGDEENLDNLEWNTETEKTIAFEFAYADGTKRKTNELKDGKPLMPTLEVNVVKRTNTNDEDFTFKKLPNDAGWDGTFQLKWNKNTSTYKKGININFTYGNQTISDQSTQQVGPLKITTAAVEFGATGVTDAAFISKIESAEGTSDCEDITTGFSWSADKSWVTGINTTAGSDYGKITLPDNNTTTAKEAAKVTIKVNDAEGTISSVTQKAYTIKTIAATSTSGTVTVSNIKNDSDGNIASSAYEVTIEGNPTCSITKNGDGTATITGLTVASSYNITVTAYGATSTANVTVE